ncbi:MAG: hypothetical protein FWG69_03450 [Oscillospiraceae bacterium]|nr:hypothetical protein [Oscillospiraceae bacterium]
MNSDAIKWLLEDNNPAVKYRTMTEILGESADKEPVITWMNKSLPDDWTERKGLWSVYYLTAFAECGLNFEDIPSLNEKIKNFGSENYFGYGCADFMLLRALVKLGYKTEVKKILETLDDYRLPDGGFICERVRKKIGYIPKSCYKANIYALFCAAECRKTFVCFPGEEELIDYFFGRNIFYRRDESHALIMDGRPGWRIIDTFNPFEPMRVGIHHVVETFCALGYGNDDRLTEAWNILNEKKDPDGKYILNGTLTKSYLPKERVGKPSKWVTFYALLAQKERSKIHEQ